MSNPTTPFSWQMPTATDLVTDLPADFEVFGQAVATSMADLLGGTSGQILAKNSNTDMDFTWVTNDVGDITAVTAGTGITGGGTSGAVTVSFDQANFGGGQFAAGKNKIINGDFGVNQRGFTSTTTNAAFTFDRFIASTVGGTSTFTAQTFTLGSAPVAGYEGKNYIDIASTGQSAAGDFTRLINRTESVRTFAGQTITVSFWAKAISGTPKVALELQQIFGTGGSPSAAVSNYLGQATLTTSWARYSLTLAIPSISGKTIGTANDDYVGLNIYTSAGSTLNSRTGSLGIQTTTISLWGIQAEAGSIATPFQTASGGNPQAELAMCQRYCQLVGVSGVGMWFSTTTCQITWPLPITMRVAPSVTLLTSTPTIADAGVANRTGSGSTIGLDTTTSTAFKANIDGFTGAVNGRVAQSATDNMVRVEAEL